MSGVHYEYTVSGKTILETEEIRNWRLFTEDMLALSRPNYHPVPPEDYGNNASTVYYPKTFYNRNNNLDSL
jgi:hypothetical protein